MDKKTLSIIATVLAIVFIVWLLAGSSITCREGFFDKDKKVIEIKTP